MTAPAAPHRVDSPSPPGGRDPGSMEMVRRVLARMLRTWARIDRWGGTAVIALVILVIVFSIATPHFLTSSNLFNIGRQTAVISLVAIGMTFVILNAGIDLSVGSVVAFSAVVAAGLSVNLELPGLLVVLLTLLTGTAIGAFNGFLVAKVGINAFIVTLGTMTMFRGLGFVYTGGYPIYGLPDTVRFAGTGQLAWLPMPLVLTVLVFVAAAVVLQLTRFGRYVYAIGGSEAACRATGVPVRGVRFSVFVVSGTLAALAGLVMAGRLGAGMPTAAVGLELEAIAAVIIGGTSLFGGKGTVYGTLAGALILGVLRNGLNLLDVDSFVIQVITGGIIILAVLLDRVRDVKGV